MTAKRWRGDGHWIDDHLADDTLSGILPVADWPQPGKRDKPGFGIGLDRVIALHRPTHVEE